MKEEETGLVYFSFSLEKLKAWKQEVASCATIRVNILQASTWRQAIAEHMIENKIERVEQWLQCTCYWCSKGTQFFQPIRFSDCPIAQGWPYVNLVFFRDFDESDVRLVEAQTTASREEAAKALQDNDGDIARAILAFA